MTSPVSLLRYVADHPATRGHRVRAVGRVLAWQVWQRTVRTPRWVTMPGGMRLRCYPHATAATAILYCGEPEWPDMPFVRRWLQPGDTFVDVGANVGVFSLLAASVPDVHLVAFEPSTDTFARLEENIAANHLGPRSVVRRCAVGDVAGTVSFTVGLDTINRVAEAGDERVEEVPVVTLDDELSDATRVTLIKVDVEGFEPQVLAGAAQVLERHRPALIIEANDRDELRQVLEPLGYVPVLPDPDSWTVTEVGWDHHHGNNLLLVPDLAAAATRLRGT